MKKTFLLMLAALPALLFAQQKYVVKGKIGTVNAPAQVFLVHEAGNQLITDSVTVKNGVFEFRGQISDIILARLTMDYKGTGLKNINGTNPDAILFYLEPGTVTVSGTDSLSKATLGGTKTNIDYVRYLATLQPISNASKALSAEYYSAPAEKRNSAEFLQYIQKKQQVIQQQATEANNRFISENPGAYMSLQILMDKLNTDNYPDPIPLETQFLKLSKELRESNAGTAYQKKIDLLKTVAVGAIAPDFSQPDTSGTLVKLSSFRGKYVLVDFWASWCGPCRAENPNVVKAYNAFKGKNFTVLSVSLDQPGKKDDWLKAIHTDGLQWNHVSDLKSWSNDAAVLYGVRAIPQNLLIGPDGKIIAKNIFGDELEKKLTEILGKS